MNNKVLVEKFVFYDIKDFINKYFYCFENNVNLEFEYETDEIKKKSEESDWNVRLIKL